MGRCIDCVHYPWLRDADPTYLPVQRCHPQLPLRRWTPEQLREQNDCPFYEPVAGAEPEQDGAGVPAAAEEEPVREAEAAEEPAPPADEPEPDAGPAGEPGEAPGPTADGGKRIYNLPAKGRGRK